MFIACQDGAGKMPDENISSVDQEVRNVDLFVKKLDKKVQLTD